MRDHVCVYHVETIHIKRHLFLQSAFISASPINSNINHNFPHSKQPQTSPSTCLTLCKYLSRAPFLESSQPTNHLLQHITNIILSRQSTTDKATSAMKPDSQKSMTEKAGDSIKSTADNVAGSAQPSGEKGVGQKASDAVSGTNNDASKQGQSVLDSASETLGNAAQSAQDALGMGKK